jgi:hypothetical protein
MQEVWLKRLIRAAEQQGAKIPSRWVINILFWVNLLNGKQRNQKEQWCKRHHWMP